MDKKLWQTSTLQKTLIQITDGGHGLPLRHPREVYTDQNVKAWPSFTLLGSHEAPFKAILVQHRYSFLYCLVMTREDVCGKVTVTNPFVDEECTSASAAEDLAVRISDFVSDACVSEMKEASWKYGPDTHFDEFNRAYEFDGPQDFPLLAVLRKAHETAVERFRGSLWPAARRAIDETDLPLDNINLFSPHKMDPDDVSEIISNMKEWGCFCSLLSYRTVREGATSRWGLGSEMRSLFDHGDKLLDFARIAGKVPWEIRPNAIVTHALASLLGRTPEIAVDRKSALRTLLVLARFAEELEFGFERDELTTGEDVVFCHADRAGRTIARFLGADDWLVKVAKGDLELSVAEHERKQYFVQPDGESSSGLAIASVVREILIRDMVTACFPSLVGMEDEDPIRCNVLILSNLRTLTGYEEFQKIEASFDAVVPRSEELCVEDQPEAQRFVRDLVESLFPDADKTRSKWMLMIDLDFFSAR
jgi:hypothetical protein